MGNLLTLAALVFIFSFQLRSFRRSKKKVIDNGVTKSQYKWSILLFWLYLVPMAPFIISIEATAWLLMPIPIGVVFFIPGIIYGRKLSQDLETSGVDYKVEAGRTFDSMKWLGLGGLIYVLGGWVFNIAVLTL